VIRPGGRSTAASVLLVAWALVLAVLLLGPALGPGYVLSYDMVWVPDLAIRPDLLGLGSGLPRAVPSDAVVAVLDNAVPGMVLQKAVLLGVLVAGALGATRLAPASLVGRLVAVTVFEWNPYVVERLLLGHWPMLVTYAALPWIVDAVRRWSGRSAPPTRLWLLLPLASLSISGGLAAGVLLLVLAVRWERGRLLWAAALVGCANAPWAVAGLLHVSSATTDPAGAVAFALSAEGSVPAPVAALGLGGVWNSEVVPASHAGPAGWLWVVVVLTLAGCGARAWARRSGRREVVGLVACWVVGWTTAVLTWVWPGLVGRLAADLPGAGALRDGARLLVLCAPLVVALCASGADRLWARAPGVPAARAGLVAALVLLPLALMPDAAGGGSGRLRPARFPASYAVARDRLLGGDGAAGDVLLLPFTAYRQPGWNHDHKVLDPLGRYLTPDYVANDALVVGGETVAGEDPRAAAVARALDLAGPRARARALADLGIGYVATERDAPGPLPAVAGSTVVDRPDLLVTALDRPRARRVPTGWWVAMGLAWLCFAGSLAAGALLGVRGALRARRPARAGMRHASVGNSPKDAV